MSTRHRAREVALQILYRFDAPAVDSPPGNPPALAGELSSHLEHFHVPQDCREFAAELAGGTLLLKDKLDVEVNRLARNWRIDRMSNIDRNILRLGIYELTHSPATPPAVVIDEAVELAKGYGSAESPAFVNGILDSFRRETPAGS